MNEKRNGNFTSSEIIALTTFGKREMTKDELDARPKKGVGSKTTFIEDGFGDAAKTYITETNMERRLLRALTNETNARALSWGKLCESKVFQLLGPDYRLCSQETIDHPTIEYWKGSPDAEKFIGENKDACIDIKCPMTLKSFCTMVDAFAEGDISKLRDNHKDGDKYYWQIVSNAILLGCDWGELIVYVPYEDELEEIRVLANQQDGDNIHKYYWIAMGNDDEMPTLKRGGYYKNINVLRFEIPKADKEFLTNRVLTAGKDLVPFHQIK